MPNRDYDGVMDATEPVQTDQTRFAPLEVRARRIKAKSMKDRDSVTMFVVHHGTESVLFESRPAFQHDVNPSPDAVAGKAEGFARGFLAGHPDHTV